MTDLAQVLSATRGLSMTNKEKYSEKKGGEYHDTFLEGVIECLSWPVLKI